MKLKELWLSLSDRSVNRFLLAISLCFFLFMCYFSFTWDAIFPLNYVNLLFAGVFAASTILLGFLNKSKPTISVFLVCNAGLLVSILLSFLANGCKSFPKTPLLMVGLSVVVFLLLDSNRQHLRLYLVALLIATWLFLFSFLAVNFHSVLRPDFSKRIGTKLGNENDVARHLVFAFVVNCAFLPVFKRKALLVFVLLAAALSAYFLLLTGSMSNILLAGILAFLTVIILTKKKAKTVVLIVSALAIVLLVAVVAILPALEPIRDRLLSILATFIKIPGVRYDASAAERFKAAVYGFRLFFESPLFGNGLNSVASNFRVMAHNNFAEIGADYGIFALVFEEILICYPLFKGKGVGKRGKAFVLLAGSFIFLTQFFLVVFNSKIESIVLAVVYALINENDLALFMRDRPQDITSLVYEVTI